MDRSLLKPEILDQFIGKNSADIGVYENIHENDEEIFDTEIDQKNEFQMRSIVIAAFYCFKNIENVENLRQELEVFASQNSLLGTILLASEGINSTISGNRNAIDNLKNFLINQGFEDMTYKESYATYQPFKKLKIKIKPEIVTIKASLDVENMKGSYIEPKDWDDFIAGDNIVLIDTRNDYEVEMGTFKNAINPHTTNFSEIKAWLDANYEKFRDKKIAMTCTGGIRCEKSTAYIKQTFNHNEVYHLKGGILQYLEDTKNQNNMWQGTCFVFDDRRAVDEELEAVN